MAQALGVKVPFIAANVTRCLCPRCPVQTKSQCVRGKLANLKEAVKANSLKREDIPVVYCSTGIAACHDLDFKQSCICGACPVFNRYQLGGFRPMGFYCRDGNAR